MSLSEPWPGVGSSNCRKWNAIDSTILMELCFDTWHAKIVGRWICSTEFHFKFILFVIFRPHLCKCQRVTNACNVHFANSIFWLIAALLIAYNNNYGEIFFLSHFSLATYEHLLSPVGSEWMLNGNIKIAAAHLVNAKYNHKTKLFTLEPIRCRIYVNIQIHVTVFHANGSTHFLSLGQCETCVT